MTTTQIRNQFAAHGVTVTATNTKSGRRYTINYANHVSAPMSADSLRSEHRHHFGISNNVWR